MSKTTLPSQLQPISMDNKISRLLLEHVSQIEYEHHIFWSARELAKILGYESYRGFVPVIRKAKRACENSGNNINHHFHDISEKTPNKRHSLTTYLSQFACHLIIQNANPDKNNVAIGQSYLANHRHLLERTKIQQGDLENTEDMSRLLLRNEVVRHNKTLAKTARMAGVSSPEDFSAFQNQGYLGLYEGLDHKRLHQKKGLKPHQKVLDYMGSTELAANLFRVTQTEEKLQRDNVQNKLYAFKTHHEVGKIIRQTIKDLGGTLPENLPIAAKSVKNIERKS